MKTILLTLTILAMATLPAKSADKSELIARSGDYGVLLQTSEDVQMSTMVLAKKEGDKTVTVDGSEDIYPVIVEHCPPEVAADLASQLVRAEIAERGGSARVQGEVNARVKKSGVEYYSYLHPIAKTAYEQHGVIIP